MFRAAEVKNCKAVCRPLRFATDADSFPKRQKAQLSKALLDLTRGAVASEVPRGRDELGKVPAEVLPRIHFELIEEQTPVSQQLGKKQLQNIEGSKSINYCGCRDATEVFVGNLITVQFV